MKGIKTLVSATAIAVCLGAASMANAATIVPNGAFTTSAGTIVVKSPSSFGAPVTCGITFSGNVSGGVATITGASLTGGGLCGLPKLKNIPSPGWVLTANDLTNGTVTNVGFTVAFPASNCGASTIAVKWDPATKTISANNQALSGNCSVDSLAVQAPGLSVQ
ncbi:alkane oxidation protein activator PraB [Pseudomonas piscis]|uniref:alkane oxidation protein activator PraB n=1 Tax=Pseudomonas piscis TaxID=2614538 RepID=UPI0021D5B5C9|nr:alkane oxidation protein activator PraB [Pseudomonas piscis]MCU7646368.1 protein activator of alkane oxidation PraB [Pseudomonas piscis]